MTLSLAFYADAAGTTPAPNPLPLIQDKDGVLPPAKATVYMLSLATGKQFQAASDPGVDQVQVTVDDTAPSSGQPASAIRLATTEGGLAAATPGAPLNLGTTVLSGTGNGHVIWMDFDDSTGVVGTDLGIRLLTNALIETDV